MRNKKDSKKIHPIFKAIVLLLSLGVTLYIYTTVSTTQWYTSKEKPNQSLFEGTYVIEDLKIKYKYDKDRYEIVNLSQKPYAVVKGSKDLINVMKWSGKDPEFVVDLTNKQVGTYRVPITYSGIDKRLTVDLYTDYLNIRVREQETVKLKPTIEIIGDSTIPKGFAIKTPILSQDEVSIRDTQVNINKVTQVKGVLDVSGMRETTKTKVMLKAYDKEGQVLDDVNLIESYIIVEVPIEDTVKIVEKPVIVEKEVIVKEKPTNKDKVTNNKEKEDKKDKNDKEKPTKPVENPKPDKDKHKDENKPNKEQELDKKPIIDNKPTKPNKPIEQKPNKDEQPTKPVIKPDKEEDNEEKGTTQKSKTVD